jgi:hypothetical protein
LAGQPNLPLHPPKDASRPDIDMTLLERLQSYDLFSPSTDSHPLGFGRRGGYPASYTPPPGPSSTMLESYFTAFEPVVGSPVLSVPPRKTSGGSAGGEATNRSVLSSVLPNFYGHPPGGGRSILPSADMPGHGLGVGIDFPISPSNRRIGGLGGFSSHSSPALHSTLFDGLDEENEMGFVDLAAHPHSHTDDDVDEDIEHAATLLANRSLHGRLLPPDKNHSLFFPAPVSFEEDTASLDSYVLDDEPDASNDETFGTHDQESQPEETDGFVTLG